MHHDYNMDVHLFPPNIILYSYFVQAPLAPAITSGRMHVRVGRISPGCAVIASRGDMHRIYDIYPYLVQLARTHQRGSDPTPACTYYSPLRRPKGERAGPDQTSSRGV